MSCQEKLGRNSYYDNVWDFQERSIDSAKISCQVDSKFSDNIRQDFEKYCTFKGRN